MKRLFYRLADDNTRCVGFDLSRMLGVQFASAVDWTAERVNDTTNELRSDGHFEHASSAPNLVAFLELEVIAKNNRADVVLFQVQRERSDDVAGLRRRTLEHLASHSFLEAVNAGDSVLNL